ncbi:MAG: response regulator [SAR324 cluster bacterium]|nr:response regulator [SAR324 cluster bacterium]
MPKILIVDDELLICQNLRILLTDWGYDSGYVNHPRLLIPRLQQESIDLVLLDLHMPEVNGLTLLRQLKQHPEFQTIPVIILTGDPNEQLVEECLNAGAMDFINKPGNPLVIRARLQSALQRHQGIKQLKMTLEKRELDFNTVSNVNWMLADMRIETEILRTILSSLHTHLKLETGAVYLFQESGELTLQLSYPEADDTSVMLWDDLVEEETPEKDAVQNSIDWPALINAEQGIANDITRDKRIVFLPDTTGIPTNLELAHLPPKTLLCVPLLDRLELKGLVYFLGSPEETCYQPEDEAFVMTISKMVVSAMKNLEMMNQIREYTQTLEQKVQERTASIQELLDNTGQGFLSFGRDYKIRPEFSHACLEFFHGPIGDLDVLQLLFSPSDVSAPKLRNQLSAEQLTGQPDNVREVLDMVFNGMATLDLLGEILPRETSKLGRILKLEYLFLEGNESKFMVILSDVSLERELAAQVEEEEKRNAMIVKVALDRDGFVQFLRELEKLFMELYSLLGHEAPRISVNDLFRYYHTIKGGSASYGLMDMAKAIHDIESGMEAYRSGKVSLNEKSLMELMEQTMESQKVFLQTMSDLRGIISQKDLIETERMYKIRESKLQHAEEKLLDMFKDTDRTEPHKIFEQLRLQPIAPILQKYAITTEGLSQRLNKPVQVEILGQDVEVSYDHLSGLFEALTHLIRNSVDHGIEEQSLRIMLEKPQVGTIRLEALREHDTLHLKISDDGKGIDPEQIKVAAIRKNLIAEQQAMKMSRDELIQMMFTPGFSTKEEVSEISGRGVGMYSVKEAVKALGGEILIETEIGKGTTFDIVIPHSF